jgi:hypothetical protein
MILNEKLPQNYQKEKKFMEQQTSAFLAASALSNFNVELTNCGKRKGKNTCKPPVPTAAQAEALDLRR